MSSGDQTTNQSNQTSSLETDISTLASLIASIATAATTNGDRTGDPGAFGGDDIGEFGAEDVKELIHRLEVANCIAGGVGDKLDGILQRHDGLLNSFNWRQPER